MGSATPLWVTLLVGVLGPLATVVAVTITTRESIKKLRMEQVEARASEERVQLRDFADRRSRFEIEKLGTFDEAASSLVREVRALLRSNAWDQVLFRARTARWKDSARAEGRGAGARGAHCI